MTFIPTEVAHYIEALTEIGLPYEIEYDLPRKITLVCENDRVRASATFKQRKGGWHNAKPKLTIDGQVCSYARGWGELAMIMVMPDLHLKAEALRAQFPNGFTYHTNPPHPIIGLDATDPSIPERVKLQAARVRMLLPKFPNMVIRYEHPADDLWQLRMSDVTDMNGEFVIMMRPSHGSWEVGKIMLVLVPGPDNLGMDLGMSFEKALAQFITDPNAPAHTGPVTRARQAQGVNQALEVKRHTVIRN